MTKARQSISIIVILGVLLLSGLVFRDGGEAAVTPTPTPTPAATSQPTPTPQPTRCEADRDAVQVALHAFQAANGYWPTATGLPGDIDWDKLVPGFLDAIPSTDGRCDWQVNSAPEGDVCLWKRC